MTKLLFDPIAHISAVTCINEPPGLEAGDTVHIPLRVAAVVDHPTGDGMRFWSVVLEPIGSCLNVGGVPIHIEVDLQ